MVWESQRMLKLIDNKRTISKNGATQSECPEKMFARKHIRFCLNNTSG